MEVKDTILETMEGKDTTLEIMEAKVTHINQIWCHPPVSLTQEVRNATLGTTEVKDTTLETMEAKDITLEIMEAKDTILETMEDKDTTLETMENKDTTLETMEDKDTILETMEAKDTTLEIMEAKVTILEIMEAKVTHINQIWCHPPVSPTQEVRDATLGTMVDKDTIQGDTTLVAEMATRSTSPAMALVDEASSELQLCLQTTKTLLTRAKPSPPSKLWEH